MMEILFGKRVTVASGHVQAGNSGVVETMQRAGCCADPVYIIALDKGVKCSCLRHQILLPGDR